MSKTEATTTSRSIQKVTISGLLIAVGVVIPLFSPLKVVLEPASFTLASHVAIFIAMFISPGVAASVAIGTTAGFLMGGFPLIVVLRAASHIVFATAGAFYLKKVRAASESAARLRLFSFVVALTHALFELIVVSVFYFGGTISDGYYQQGFLVSVLFLVGLGTVIHSMVDFEIARVIMIALKNRLPFWSTN